MLKSLVKYNLRFVFRQGLGILALAEIIAAVVAAIFRNSTEVPIIEFIYQFAKNSTFGIAVGMVINVLMRIWFCLRVKTYGDESYLTHTLPVKKSQIYLAHFLSAILSLVFAGMTALIGMATAYDLIGNEEKVRGILNFLAESTDSPVFMVILMLLVLMFMEFMVLVSVGFFTSIMGKNRKDGKVSHLRAGLAGILGYGISQGLIVLMIFVMGLGNAEIMSMFTAEPATISAGTFKMLMSGMLVVYAMETSAFYMINVKLLEKGVNVD